MDPTTAMSAALPHHISPRNTVVPATPPRHAFARLRG